MSLSATQEIQMRLLRSIETRLLPRAWQRNLRVQRLREAAARSRPLNVILGAGTTSYAGWIATDDDVLDITSERDWKRLFTPESIDRLLAEHVIEHLSETQARRTFAECYRYLKQGGLFRVAVPDGNRRDPAYVAEASPPKDGHQALYNVDSITQLLRESGFETTPLEYFDGNEQFQAVPWDERDGMIQRSVRFDCQIDFQRGGLYYTSLIVDARKPRTR
jgi:predicted SAM-dependent methyltransferase